MKRFILILRFKSKRNESIIPSFIQENINLLQFVNCYSQIAPFLLNNTNGFSKILNNKFPPFYLTVRFLKKYYTQICQKMTKSDEKDQKGFAFRF